LEVQPAFAQTNADPEKLVEQAERLAWLKAWTRAGPLYEEAERLFTLRGFAVWERRTGNNTWNRYYELLSTLFNRATRWKANGVPRMALNPMLAIERSVGTKKKFRVRIEETVEDKLFSACDALNRPQHKPHSKLLTWPKVEEIRKRVADDEPQSKVAAHFGISRGLCCQIIKGEIWNPAIYKLGTKGDMMRLRLMAAFDAGVRPSG